MAHHKRKKPRTSSDNRCQFPSGCPQWHNIIFHTRPRRRLNRYLSHLAKRGADVDDFAWPLGNSKPHEWFW